jgi:hypothetical protein
MPTLRDLRGEPFEATHRISPKDTVRHPDTWAYVIDRGAASTYVEFPATGRRGAYPNDFLGEPEPLS